MTDIPPPPFLEIPYRYVEGHARISLTEIRFEDQIYSHQSGDQYWHYHVGKLHQMIAVKLIPATTVSVRLTADQFRFILANRGIERSHLARIKSGDRDTPGLLIVVNDDTERLADGGHRYVRRWMDGFRTMDFLRITEAQARPAVLKVDGPMLGYVAQAKALHEAIMAPLYAFRPDG